MTYPTAMDTDVVHLQMTSNNNNNNAAQYSSSSSSHGASSAATTTVTVVSPSDFASSSSSLSPIETTTTTMMMNLEDDTLKSEPTEYFIYHERQQDLLCGKHALNALVQMGSGSSSGSSGSFNSNDLYSIAQRLDQIELDLMADNDTGGRHSPSYIERLEEGSGHADPNIGGNFSIEVLRIALHDKYQLELPNIKQEGILSSTSSSSSSMIHLVNHQDIITKMEGFICHYNSHWYTIRKINGVYWNLDSMNEKPTWMSHIELITHLQNLLVTSEQQQQQDSGSTSNWSTTASIFCIPKGLPSACSTASQCKERGGMVGLGVGGDITTTNATSTTDTTGTWWSEHDLLLPPSTATVAVLPPSANTTSTTTMNHQDTTTTSTSSSSWRSLFYSKLTGPSTTTVPVPSPTSSSSSMSTSSSSSSSSSRQQQQYDNNNNNNWEWSEEMARIALDQFAEPYSTYADGVVTFQQYHHHQGSSSSSSSPATAAAAGWVSVWN